LLFARDAIKPKIKARTPTEVIFACAIDHALMEE
jgi:hypothetical protein